MLVSERYLREHCFGVFALLFVWLVHGVPVAERFCFIVVVAEKLLYTTTTSRLCCGLCFVVCVGFGLLVGCGGCYKQHEVAIKKS